HGVGVAERHHAGGKVIAILVDQPMAIALQVAFALKALVEIVGVDGVSLRECSIDDLDAAAKLDAERRGAGAHAILASDEERGAEPLLHEPRRRTDDLLFLAFSEDDALRPPTQPLIDTLQHARHRVAPRAQLLAVASMSTIGLRATPVSIAALATAGGTAE